jgi:hypothetical protein
MGLRSCPAVRYIVNCRIMPNEKADDVTATLSRALDDVGDAARRTGIGA